MAGARGIEPRSKVLETFILTVVLCPYGKEPLYFTIESLLTLARFDFVAAEVFLSLGVPNMFAKSWVVFFKTQFVRSIHGIFARVIRPMSAFFADKSNDFTLLAFFRH